jgi:hypothetical protein
MTHLFGALIHIHIYLPSSVVIIFTSSLINHAQYRLILVSVKLLENNPTQTVSTGQIFFALEKFSGPEPIRIITSMIYETRTRSLVKTVIYRIWVLCTTYIMLLVTGQSLASALVPTLIINAVWMTSFYLYDRLWARISWGRYKHE